MYPILLAVLLQTGQTWSPAQQEIIEQIKRCNDAWVSSIEQKRFEVYDAVCPATDQAVFWYTGRDGAPAPYKGSNGLWTTSQSSQNRAFSWGDLEPVTVQIDGDVAYFYYGVTWSFESNEGTRTNNRSRRLTVFQKRNGRWYMSAGSIAAVPK
jgi:ketosteroid isomerase-like protein